MIKLKTLDDEIIVKPTIFPDGTSQVWHLPEHVFKHKEFRVTWFFETEREIIDLYSLKALLPLNSNIHLHIPYLPYARQDKMIHNNNTFNLHVLANLINGLVCDRVTAVDVHNSSACKHLIHNFENIEPKEVILDVIALSNCHVVVFPDEGAHHRYKDLVQHHSIHFMKVRDQSTGEITSQSLSREDQSALRYNMTFLIIDDLVDGGKTFINVAKEIKKVNEHAKVYLYATHGILSKGKQYLLDNGIDNVYTTNSLLKNENQLKVSYE